MNLSSPFKVPSATTGMYIVGLANLAFDHVIRLKNRVVPRDYSLITWRVSFQWSWLSTKPPASQGDAGSLGQRRQSAVF